ncbi:MAG: hypothetical protein ACRDRT_12920, partial [Pseudonocardiaceae bacterium]
MATRVVGVNDILDGHVGLDLECFDRIYLNGWVPTPQVPGQVVGFLTRHLGFPIPSPAVLERIGLGFRKAVTEFAAEGDIPVVRFGKGDRKLEVMHRTWTGSPGRVGLVWPRSGWLRSSSGCSAGPPTIPRRVAGGCRGLVTPRPTVASPLITFIWWMRCSGRRSSRCAYFPYPVEIWLNGHEYSKRAATAAGIGFTELENEFATTEDPAGLRRVCDTLGPGTIREFCERWWARLPLPLTEADRAAGYW